MVRKEHMLSNLLDMQQMIKELKEKLGLFKNKNAIVAYIGVFAMFVIASGKFSFKDILFSLGKAIIVIFIFIITYLVLFLLIPKFFKWTYLLLKINSLYERVKKLEKKKK
jgi:hypothetical protein